MTRTYLDHAATTPVVDAARDAIQRGLDAWANPSSPHGEGRAARALLEEARETIREALGWRHDVIFTSGASEAVEIAASRVQRPGRAHGATEHAIVPFAMGEGSRVIAVDCNGVIDPDALDSILAEGPALVAIQQVNNETGVIQPLDSIAEKVRASGSLLLADCAQSAGKLALPDADLVAVSAHKLGGPPGIGALLVRDLSVLRAIGGQEKGYRRGTQDVPAAMGFAAALAARPYDMAGLASLRRRLDDAVRASGGVVIGEGAPRIPTIGAVALPGANNASLLVQMDLVGIAVSAGSACASGKMQGSQVMKAMGLAPDLAASFLRVSFGPASTAADVDAFLHEWRRIAERHAKAA